MGRAKRILAIILIIPIMAATVRVRKVEAAAPFVVAGVIITAEILLIFAAMYATAGITFETQGDLEQAVRGFGESNPTAFREFIENNKTKQIGGVSVPLLDMNVAAVKTFWGYVIDFYKPYFAPSQSAPGGTVSTANAPVEFGYIDGYVVYNRAALPVRFTGTAWTTGPGWDAQLNKMFADMQKFGGTGTFVKNGIGGYDLNLRYEINEPLKTLAIFLDYGKDNLNNTFAPSVFQHPWWVQENMAAYVQFVYTYTGTISKDIYADILYLFYGSNIESNKLEYWTVDTGRVHGLYMGSSDDLVKPEFGALVNGINVLQDLAEYQLTIAEMSRLLGKVLTDYDVIRLQLDGLLGLNLESVLLELRDELENAKTLAEILLQMIAQYISVPFDPTLENMTDSPFLRLSEITLTNDILGFINWIIPVNEIVAILQLWVSAIVIYYAYSAIMRFTKMIQ